MIMSKQHKNIHSAHSHSPPFMTSHMQYNNAMRAPPPSPTRQLPPPSPTIKQSPIEQTTQLKYKFQEAFQKKLHGENQLYDQLVKHFGSLKGNQLIVAYQALSQCSSSINSDFREFLEVIFRPDIVKVLYQKGEVVEAYNNMIISLISSHQNYLQYALKLIVGNFKPISDLELARIQTSKDGLLLQTGTLSVLEQIKFDNMHSLLQLITKKVPNSYSALVKRLESDYPHHTQSLAHHRFYVTNILRITDYAPQSIGHLFQIIVQQLIKLDSEIKVPRDEEEEEEEEEEDEAVLNPNQLFEFEDMREDVPEEHRQVIMAEKLDTIINLLFTYVQKCSLEIHKFEVIFQSMMRLFHSFVVNTYQLHSIQFLMFYICSFGESYVNKFVQYLLGKIFDQQLHQEVRKCCAAYLSGFISRAKYCSVQTVVAMLAELLGWLDSYIQSFERTVTYLDVESHSIFYSICQGVFYVLCYKIHEVMKNENGVQFLQNDAPIAKIVRSKFNPFKVC